MFRWKSLLFSLLLACSATVYMHSRTITLEDTKLLRSLVRVLAAISISANRAIPTSTTLKSRAVSIMA